MLRFASALAGQRGGRGRDDICVGPSRGSSVSNSSAGRNLLRCPTGLWADEGEVVDGRPLGEMAARIQGGTDFVAMDCRIRAPPEPSSAGVNTHVLPSRNCAPADRTGREAEDPVGAIYMSSRPVAPRRPTEADAQRSIWPESSTPRTRNFSDMEKNLDLGSPAGGDTHVFPSSSTAPTGQSGRRSRSIWPELSTTGRVGTAMRPMLRRRRPTRPPGPRRRRGHWPVPARRPARRPR